MPARFHGRWLIAATAMAALCFPTGAAAQAIISARAGLLNHTEGCVLLNGKHLDSERSRLIHLVPGQRLRTEDGHAEVMLGPAVFLRLGFYSEIEVVSTDLSAPRARLWSGSVLIDANGLTNQKPVSIMVEATEVRLVKKGLYRLDLPSDEPKTLTVWNGRAVVVSASGKKTIAEKHELRLGDSLDDLVARRVERAESDPLDEWNDDRASTIADLNGELLRKLAEEEEQKKRFPPSHPVGLWGR